MRGLLLAFYGTIIHNQNQLIDSFSGKNTLDPDTTSQNGSGDEILQCFSGSLFGVCLDSDPGSTQAW